MEAAYGISSLGIQTNAVKFYYSKSKESVSKDLSGSAVGRQLLGSAPPPPCDALEIGAFYEINHENLPPKSPIHLKAVRVVKVGETTKLDVTVSFPSTYSLRNYFSSITANPSADKFPAHDERFVMSTNQAKKIIKRLVPTKKLSEEKHLHSFWIVAPFVLPCSTVAAAPSTAGEEEEEENDDDGEAKETKKDTLQLALKYSGNLQWGVRRKVKYIGRQQRDQLPSPLVKMEDNEDEMMEVLNVICMGKRAREAAHKKNKKKKERKEKEKNKKKKKREKKKARYEKSEDHGTERGSKERWSTERYESAELKLLDIMREKGAVPGNSILRLELREEARKHIGDTGLLDHLLKHMAGKLVSDGTERFRRRHNSEGAMEYWLEPAELEEVRKKAGVTDPYWLPPSGWKPGDAVSACILCGTECQKEISLLREKISILKRDMEGLQSLKLLEEVEDERQSEAVRCSNILQEKYEMLMKKNTKLEEGLEGLTSMLKGMKEEMELLKQENEKKKEVTEAVDQTKVEEAKADNDDGNAGSDGNRVNEKKTSSSSSSAVEMGKKKGVVRRSGFSICKPQGTFPWPNMTTTAGAIIGGAEAGIINNNSINNSSSSAAAVYSLMSNTTMTTSTITGTNATIGVVIPTTNAMVEYNEYQQKQLTMVFRNNGGADWGAAAGVCINGIPTPSSCSSATSTPQLLVLPSPTNPKSSTATSPSQFKAVAVNNHTSSLASSVGDHQVKKREDAAVHVSPAAWRSTIMTDLVLATPSYSSIN